MSLVSNRSIKQVVINTESLEGVATISIIADGYKEPIVLRYKEAVDINAIWKGLEGIVNEFAILQQADIEARNALAEGIVNREAYQTQQAVTWEV